MKKNSFIILIFLMVLLIFKLGAYQNKIITVKNISFTKPFLYRMQLVTINKEENVAFNIKDYLAIDNEFKLKESLLFIFKKFYTNETISLLLTYSSKENDRFKTIKNKSFQNCLLSEEKESNNKNLFVFHGLIKKSNISFILKGDDKDTVIKLRDDLCS